MLFIITNFQKNDDKSLNSYEIHNLTPKFFAILRFSCYSWWIHGKKSIYIIYRNHY